MWALKSICLWLVLALTATTAIAAPDPALRYRVVDVSAGDRLNVREQPGAGSDLLGALAPHAENIVVTGATMRADGSDWWEIVFVEGYLNRGWINGRFLEPMDEPGVESDYPLLCGGTEPFWSLEIDSGQARYAAMDEDEVSLQASPWRMASGQTGRFAVELEHDGALGHAGIWREADVCSDGMSDIRHPFGIILIRPDGEVLAGCCRRSR